MERYTAMYPCGQAGLPDDPVAASAWPAQPLGLRRLGGHGPRDVMTPRGSSTSAWPPHRAASIWSRLRAIVALMISSAHGSTNSQRRDASSTRSWTFYIKSSALTSGHAIDTQHRMLLCRASPTRGTWIGVSADRQRISRATACLRRQHERRSPTTIDAPTKV
jgi:hypothetical protein